MLVVSDSSPLNFLIRLQCVEILRSLYGVVLIPPKVEEELTRPATPELVKKFMANKPEWLQVRALAALENIPRLHEGEVAAISLALEVHANLIVLDDWAAREAARNRGLPVTGLLGILERADERGLLNFVDRSPHLPLDYRIDSTLVDAVVERCRRRREEESNS
jgi:predicted nucleic acid-binding protein